MDKGPSPKHQELGDTLLRSCFFACYKERRETYNSNRYQFDSEKAFGLIENHGLIDDYEKLIAQLFVRIKEPTAIWDALGYCVQVLQDPNQSETQKLRAEGMVAVVLNAETPREHSKRFQHTAVHALGAIHSSTQNEDLKTAIVNFLDTRLHHGGWLLLRNMLAVLPENAPQLLHAVMARLEAKQTPATWQRITTILTTGLFMDVSTPYVVDPPPSVAGQFFFSQLSGEQLLVQLRAALSSCANAPERLDELIQNLSMKTWTQEQKDAVRNDACISTAVMLYLYQHASSPDSPGPLAEGALPTVAWQPLPLLAKIYPEHAPLWRTMQLGILGLNPQGPEDFGNHAPSEKTQMLMRNFFDMFAKSFSSNTISFGVCQGIIEGLGIPPMEYFINHMHAAPSIALELPENMFDLA